MATTTTTTTATTTTMTTETLPSSRKGVVQSSTQPGVLELATDLPMPTIPADQVLIKVSAVAINHCDYKMPARIHVPGALDGCDFSGTIVHVGASVDPARLKLGDRVAGAQMASQARRPWSGAFTEYIAEKPDNLWRIPGNMSWEEAASIGCAVASSVGMALWWDMKLKGTPEEPLPPTEQKFVLVYGGSTASGTFAMQLLKMSGYRVITTCSPKNFSLVQEYGAEKAFDYHSPTCGDEIRAYTKNSLEYALDIITEARTIRQCYAAIGRGGGRYVGFELLPDDLMATMRKAVKPSWVMGLEVAGVELELPGGYYRPANPELHAWLHVWIRRFAALIESGRLRPHPIQVNKGGLAKVIEGLGLLQRKEVSAQKLVYPLYE